MRLVRAKLGDIFWGRSLFIFSSSLFFRDTPLISVALKLINDYPVRRQIMWIHAKEIILTLRRYG